MLRSAQSRNTNAWRIAALAIALVASFLLILFAGAERSEAAGKLLYPDLKTVKPANLQLQKVPVSGRTRYLLYFDNTVYNRGEGPLDLRSKTVNTRNGEKTRVYQRLYDNKGNYKTTESLGTFVYHPSHRHFHFGGFAEYEFWTKYEYKRWERSGGDEGRPKRKGAKTSFCVLDTENYLPDKPGNPGVPEYDGCNTERQGISVGWADTYAVGVPEQWLDLGTTPLVEGKKYVLRSVADPDNRIYESPKRRDHNRRESDKSNAAVTFFTVSNGTVRTE